LRRIAGTTESPHSRRVGRDRRRGAIYGGRTLPPSRRIPPRALRIALLALVAGILLLAQRYGVFHRFASPARVAQTLVDSGGWGYLTFVVAYGALNPVGVPGTVFVLAATLIWPWPVAFGLSMVGTMAASVNGFVLNRLILREWISRLIPARFRKYDEALATRAFVTVFFLRLVFWMPPLLHAFFGVSKVRFWTHFWGSLAGYVLPLFLLTFFGPRVFDALKSIPLATWIELGAAAAAAVAIALSLRLLRRRVPATDQE
jgi:uncharacterized membrane protein YdjX (TVP38/TMEM64 family)